MERNEEKTKIDVGDAHSERIRSLGKFPVPKINAEANVTVKEEAVMSSMHFELTDPRTGKQMTCDITPEHPEGIGDACQLINEAANNPQSQSRRILNGTS